MTRMIAHFWHTTCFIFKTLKTTSTCLQKSVVNPVGLVEDANGLATMTKENGTAQY